MQKLKLLVLTDHTGHSFQNSLYALVKAMRLNECCAFVDVASRGLPENNRFFKKMESSALWVNRVGEHFDFHPEGLAFQQNLRMAFFPEYDAVWLRMPPPLGRDFLYFLDKKFPSRLIFNDPLGIWKTGSKEFLTNFPDVCPPLKICRSVEDIVEFKNQFPIVLKPFRDYGGKGVVRIDGEQAWVGKKEMTFSDFAEQNENAKLEYLAVKFLKNVHEGDKRIVVVDGQVMGASLRLPAGGSWLCNVAMGGKAVPSKVDADEMKIVERINPTLSEMGIVMYGVDTLVGDDGRRVLSEINTTSIGGLPQMAAHQGEPLVEQAVDLLWNFITKKINEKNAVANSE